jgi:predicted DNA-binding WGR domain protein
MVAPSPVIEFPFSVGLRAIHDGLNVARFWRLRADLDLLGRITVVTEWGRIGTRGHTKRMTFDDADNARRQIASSLNRRGTAERRVGVAYAAEGLAGAQAPLPFIEF